MNYHANNIDSLFALICNISDTYNINNEGRVDISRLDVLEIFAGLKKFEYSLSSATEAITIAIQII